MNNGAAFSNLVNLYIKVNNYWSVELECSIADDVPDNADYENIITTDLYNLLSVLDALISSNFLGDRKYQPYTGLYDALMIPTTKNE